MNNNNYIGWLFFGGYKNILPSMLTILPSSSTRAIFVNISVNIFFILLKAIQYYINIIELRTLYFISFKDTPCLLFCWIPWCQHCKAGDAEAQWQNHAWKQPSKFRYCMIVTHMGNFQNSIYDDLFSINLGKIWSRIKIRIFCLS